MWLVFCRRQGMLMKGPAPNPKCKLNISSFITLPHLWDCFILPGILYWLYCYYKWWRDAIGGWWLINNRVFWGGDRGWELSCNFSFCFFFSLVLLSFVVAAALSVFKWLEHDSCRVCFFVSLSFYFFSLSLVHLTRSYWCIEVAVSVM